MQTAIKKSSEFHSGTWQPQFGYQSFMPVPVNNEWLVDDLVLLQLLSEADRKLGVLDTYFRLSPAADSFTGIFEKKEAASSCSLDGIEIGFSDAIMFETDIPASRKKAWTSAQKYLKGMQESARLLQQVPFSTRRMKDTHKLILPVQVDGYNLPGEYRSGQFWIGGKSVRDARYVPPHFSQISELMKDLESFMTNDTLHTPSLLRAGISLYQYETIHPFGEGNGRVGRIYLMLYLIGNQLLANPVLCLSDYFLRNKKIYEEHLTLARNENNLNRWLRCFLSGIIETADFSIKTIEKIVTLHKHIETERLGKVIRRSESSTKLLDILFRHPVLTGQKIKQLMHSNDATTNRLIDQFIAGGILQEKTGFRRNRMFEFDEYLKAFEPETAK